MIEKQTVLAELGNEQLMASLDALSVKENETTVEVILHLAEIERRGLHIPAGFASLFAYCVSKLRYSEPAANRRISCARAVAEFPELLPLLLAKDISLSTLCLAAGILNSHNKDEIIGGIKGKSRREVEEFVAQYRPRKIVREVIKALVLAKTSSPEQNLTASLFEAPANKQNPQTSTGSFASECALKMPEKERQSNQPTEKRYELRFSVGEEVMKKLVKAKALLSGKYPSTVLLEQVLDTALEHLLEKRSPERRELRRVRRKENPNPANAPINAKTNQSKPSRHIPQEIQDKVYLRDAGQCAFISEDGTRCPEKHRLQYHHIQPYGLKGKNEFENISLRCALHNAYQAELDYGKNVMSYYKKSKTTAT